MAQTADDFLDEPADPVALASARYDVPEDRIRAVIQAESGGKARIVSPKGAMGLMQLMPGTARDLGVDAMDPVQNVDGGVRYLRHLYDRFGDWDQAHAAYNFGPERVARGEALPLETQGYLRKINATLAPARRAPAAETAAPSADAFLDARPAAKSADEFLGPEPKKAPPPEESSALRRYVADPVLSLVKGVMGVPEAFVGLADIPTGGAVGKFLDDNGVVRFKAARAAIDAAMSPEQQDANRRVDEAKGFGPTVEAALENPSTIAHSVVESAPSVIGAGGIARGVAKALPRVAPLVAGAIGEGVLSAGQTAEQVRQDSATGELTPEAAGLSVGSGFLTGLLGVAGGKVARRLGIADIDSMLAGAKTVEAKKGLVRRVLEGAVSEGVLEELPQSTQEQIAQNVAEGKPWNEGIDKAAVMGMFAGAAMGAGANVRGGHPAAQASGMSPEEQAAEWQRLNAEHGATVPSEAERADARHTIDFQPPAPAPDPTTSLGATGAPGDPRAERIRNVTNAITVLEDNLVRARDAGPEVTQRIAAQLQEMQARLEELTWNGRAQPALDMPQGSPLDGAQAVEAAIAEREAVQRQQAEVVPYERVAVPSPLSLAPLEAPGPVGNEIDIQPFLAEQRLLRANGISLADWLGQGDLLGRPFHPETIDLMSAIDSLGHANPAAAAAIEREIEAFKPTKESHGQAQQSEAAAPVAPAPDAQAARNGGETGQAPATASAGPGDAAQVGDVAGKSDFTHGVKPDISSVDAAAHQAATSPKNDLPQPTEAQKDAGNYQKGHVRISGIDISIENPAGSKRRPEWPTMKSHYGYIRGTIGRDKDHVDVFVKPGTRLDWTGPVFVVDQIAPKGRFDEHKVVMGAASMEDAKKLYSENYTVGWKVGPVTQMTLPQFQAWTQSKFTKRPVKSLSLAEWQSLHTAHERGDQDAELAAAKASLRDTVVRPRYDSLQTILGKLGGLNLKSITTDGFDPKDAKYISSGVRNFPALRVKGGHSLDYMAEKLAELGFDVLDEQGLVDQSKARDLLDTALSGAPVYAPEGHEFWAARNDMEEYQRERDSRGESLLEQQEPAKPAAPPERRKDDVRRKRISEMSLDEARQALRTDVLVGIGNRRAWEEIRESAPKAHVAALDVDSLGWVNDNLGHAGGDQYLEAVGQALRDEGIEAYRTGGDEIMVQADDAGELRMALAMVRERLADIEVTAIKGDERITKKGVGLSYGIGPDEKTADNQLYANKREREDAGLRPAKGHEPADVVRQPAVETGPHRGEATSQGQGVAQPLGRYGNSEAFAVPAAQGRGPDFALKSADGQLDLFAASPVSDLPGGARAVFATEVAPARKGEVKSGVERVRSAADAAHVFAGLRKHPREYFAALLLDKEDRPLAYLDLYRGTISQTPVYPGVLAMTAYQTPGAVKVWLAHNHPSGKAEPSIQDQALTRTIREHFTGTGIEYAGHVIIAGNQFHDLEGSLDGGPRSQPIPPLARKHAIPIMERAVRKGGKLDTTAVTSPDGAKRMVEQLSNGQEGLLLLDTQMRPVAYLPMTLKSAAKLRTGDAETGYGALVKSLGRANAASAIAYVPHSIEGKEGYRQGAVNLGDALNGLDVRFLDVISKGDAKTFASAGLPTSSGGPFYRHGTGDGMTEQAARKALAETIQKTRVPIRVHADVESLRRVAGLENSPDDVKGVYWNGVIHAVAGAHADPVDLQSTVARHEVTHAGIYALYGSKGARAIALKDIASKNPNLRRAADEWYATYGEEKIGEYMKGGVSRADAERMTRLDAIEEGLAHGSQDLGNTLNGWKAFVATIQKGLRAMGLNALADHLETASNAEVLSFLNMARRATEESRREGATSAQPAFARTSVNLPPFNFPGKSPPATPPPTPPTPPQAPKTTLATPNSWTGPAASRADNIIYTLQDKHVDTKRVVKAIENAHQQQLDDAVDPYLQEELFHGRAAAGVDDFLHAELKPLLKDMATRGVKIDAFEEWLHARHAPEANAYLATINNGQQGLAGMSDADARAVMAKAQQQGLTTAYQALAAKVDAINARTRSLMVGYGLEEPAAIAAWQAKYKHYVPLQREDMDSGPGIGQGFSVRGPASKQRTGSTRAVTNILANVALQRERIVVRGEKNRVANAVYGLALANPNPAFWRVDLAPTVKSVDPRTGLVTSRIDPLWKGRDNVVVARSLDAAGNVVEHAVVFNEHDDRAQRMAASLKNLDLDQLGTVIGTVAKATRFIAAMSTQYNPVFGVVNITRDVQEAMLNLTTTPIAGKQAEVASHVLPALRGIYLDLRDVRAGKAPTSSWAQTFEEFQREGGKTGYRDMFRTSDERAEALKRELAKPSITMKTIGPIADWLSDYNEAMENAVRLAAYKVAIESGLSKSRAASLAKNLTVNFNRKGQASSQLGALYAFFNASAQGTARMAETLMGPKGKQIIAGGVMLGVLQAVALAAAGFDDDEPPEFVREKNLIIPIGGKKYVMIPMPLGFLVFPNLGRVATEFVMRGFKNPGKRVAELLAVVVDAFSPLGNVASFNAKSAAQVLSPTLTDPVVALATNQDWTGKPIYREDLNKMHPTPGHKRNKDTATEFSKWMSEALNAMTGGSSYKPGAWSPTADEIDYLVGQVTGGVGREISKGSQFVGSLISGEDLPPYKVPLGGRFYGDAGATSSQATKFYDNLKDLAEHGAELKGRRMHNEPTTEYLRDNPEAHLVPAANEAERTVASLRRQKHELLAKGGSKDQVKALEERMNNVMARFNERVKAARP